MMPIKLFVHLRGLKETTVVFVDDDRIILERCLARQPRSWENFVNRFLGLVLHVIRHTSQTRTIRISEQDAEDLAAEVFLALIRDDFAVLRRFRRTSSLATYLTVVSRRVIVRELMRRKGPATFVNEDLASHSQEAQIPIEDRISNREEVERLMSGLNEPEADVVRMYHLEGLSYREISSSTGVPENSIGPTLSRARSKMRQASVDPTR